MSLVTLGYTFRKKALSACWCLGLALVLNYGTTQKAEAQTLYGSLVGNVSDSTGAVIAGATVSVTQKETGFTRDTTTDSAGGYNLSTVPTGNYDVKVSLKGFKTFEKSGIPVTLNTISRVDASLEVGAMTQTVEVKADTPLLQTDSPEVRHELTSKTLENIPLPPGRNFEQSFRTIPGFNPPSNSHSIPSNPSRALAFTVNGTVESSQDVRIDGASQYNIWLPHVVAYVPALESIQTVNVVTNDYSPEQGLAGGSSINVQIKSGTNNTRGSGFEYHNDNALETRPYFIPGRVPKDVYNQFGGTIGGPIKKDKLFYFVSYEGTRERQFANRFGTVPTMAMRSGDLSAAGAGVTIYDPSTGNADGTGRTPFSCAGVANTICANQLSPITQKILTLLPEPNVPGAKLSNNYLASAPFSFNRSTLDSKVDWNASSKLTSYARFSALTYNMNNPQMFGKLGGPGTSSAGGNPGKGYGHSYSSSISATYLWRPAFVVDGSFGYTMMDTADVPERVNEKLGLDFLGIPGTNGTRPFEGGWPRFDISGFTALGTPDGFEPYYRHDPQYHWSGNATWNHNTHNVRFGGDFVRQDLNHQQPEFAGQSHGPQGGFSFGGGPTQLKMANGKASKANSYNNFATFLLGYDTVIQKNFQVPDQFTTRTNELGVFFGDQWQFNRKLTLTYGTRWEYFPMPYRTSSRGMERYDFANNTMMVCGAGSVPKDCGVKTSKKYFAPRFGFAYRATPTFVVRAGYGITYDPYNLAVPLRTNYPTLIPLDISAPSSFGVAGLLANGIPPISVPDLGNGIIPIPGTVAVNSLGPTYDRGYIQSWNVMLEKQLPGGWVAQGGYVATRTIRQLGFLDQNVGQVGGGNSSKLYNTLFKRTARTALVGPIANTHYDSLQTSLSHRFSHGFDVKMAYTYSKTIGMAGAADSNSEPRIKLPQYYYLNRGLSDLDLPHHLEATLVAELPFGTGKRYWSDKGWVSKLTGGWQANAIFSRFSGSVFSVTSSGTSLNAPGNTQRADQVKQNVSILGGHGFGSPYFDPFAFAPVTDVRFGTASFNNLRGPGATNLDLGLFREFSISERTKLQFRAEAFNFTNTPHFSNPGANASDLQLNGDGTIKNLGGYDEINGTRSLAREGIDQRQFRFGLRLSF